MRRYLVLALMLAVTASHAADQSTFKPLLNSATRTLEFDWPTLQIGTAEYAEGPTGVTVFRFGRRVLGTIDVRGGGPGTVNSDYLRLGYDTPELDAVVFSGGSWYGLEAATAANTALKDDGVRNGDWINIGLTVGSIIYDLGDRRFNEIYPDKRLAQAAFRAVQPGRFPLGAQGAGRHARSGSFFGCNAHGGQGGAFKQIGDVKIAAFTVVNAVGVVSDRSGRVVACYPGPNWPQPLMASDLLSGTPASRRADWSGARSTDAKRNTTISLVVTNQTLTHWELSRFAAQVHTSMARSIQPFATEHDGDVLYAVSTQELPRQDNPAINAMELGVVAGEVMWDAILASVPEQPTVTAPVAGIAPSAQALKRLVGDYVFSELVTVRITNDGGRLNAQAVGERDAFAIKRNGMTELQPVSATLFTVPGRYPLTLSFDTPGQLIINPGHWQQAGARKK